jgi:transcription antitermination factor NusG
LRLLDLKKGDVVGYVDRAPLVAPASDAPRWWHIVVTGPAREKSTIERLSDLQLRSYLPLIHKKIPAGRSRKRDVEVAMFPCYLFVQLQLSPRAWRQVRAVRGVHDFLMIDQDRPALLTEEAVEAIRWKERGLDAKRLQRMAIEGKAPFELGERVWVKDMLPFTTLLANVSGFDARGRVEVLLEMEILGRKFWQIEPHLLQKIEI